MSETNLVISVDKKAEAEMVHIAEAIASFTEKHIVNPARLAAIEAKTELLLAELLQGVVKLSDGTGSIVPLKGANV